MRIELTKLNHRHHRLKVMPIGFVSDEAVLDTVTYLLHDLCHYSVERELRIRAGFWGLLAGGHRLDDLRGKTNPLTAALREIEPIVGFVQGRVRGQVADEVVPYVLQQFTRFGLTSLGLSVITGRVHQLLHQFTRLHVGQPLVLSFEEAADAVG